MVKKTLAEWQTPWTGKYDPLNYAPNGAWYGRGLTSRVDRPLTVNKMVSMIVHDQSVGGIAPSRWELSRELAEELAADAVMGWFMSGLSHSDVMKQIAYGTLKICDVPIVMAPDKAIPAMSDPGCVEFVAAAVGENIARIEADSRSKKLQTLRVTEEYDRLADAAEQTPQQVSPVKEPNIRLGLRPPQEYADKRNHWIEERDGNRSVWEWTIGKWFIPGICDLIGPDDTQLTGWKYLGPAEYNAQVVTPGKWCDADITRLGKGLHDRDVEILRLRAENHRLRGVAEAALKAANPLYKVDVHPTKDDIIRGYELVCGGFGTFAEPDVAPSPPTASKPPIPLRALQTDRQTIGLREWK